ncbi:MAG: mycofactocin biosynthesis peptidyl-dipeptidase MftE [Mycobacteriales bacterium]
MSTIDLTVASWPQVGGGLLVVPIGSCEQHGPHLPFDVDTAVAAAVARRFALPDTGVVLAPPLAYGASGEHEGFPGTVSIGTAALTTVIVELGRSAARWATRVLIVNGHGGNVQALVSGVGQLRREGLEAAWWSCSSAGADAHAGRTETSLMLHLRPAVVDAAAASAGRCEPIADLLPRLRRDGMKAVSPNGVLGDPTGASAAAGEQVLATLTADLRAAAARWQIRPDARLAAPA